MGGKADVGGEETATVDPNGIGANEAKRAERLVESRWLLPLLVLPLLCFLTGPPYVATCPVPEEKAVERGDVADAKERSELLESECLW
jgi:hypothetical protein